jgi:hypothetical protein
MSKNSNGKELMYTSIVWLHDLRTLCIWATNTYKSIIVDGGVRSFFQANGTSTYVSNGIVYLNIFW